MAESSKSVPKAHLAQARAQCGYALKHYHDQRYSRPRTRAECGMERPCPWVSCRHHLYLEVKETGSIQLPFPCLQPWELEETCSLDVADQHPAGLTLIDVGVFFGLTRERVRQIEARALRKIKEGKDFKHE